VLLETTPVAQLLKNFPTFYGNEDYGRVPCGIFLFDVPTKTMYKLLFSPIRATGPAHLIVIDLIVLIISGEKYKL
jgi:hypothetical protein